MNSVVLSRGARVLLVFWLAIVGCLTAFAQGLPTASPESVGLSAQRLERIGAIVQRDIDENRLSGSVTLVARKGCVAWFKAQGMMDKEAGKPMKPDAIFRICSMTKPITSVAIMMLYEEGRFLLNDPVSKFIPEFKNPKVLVRPPSGEPYAVPANKEITIRQLLTHTSGLTYHWNPDLGARYKEAGVAHGLLQYNGKIADNIKALAGLPLLFPPGERYEYSLSVDVLGYLVEVVSGMSLDEFFRKRIFEPLGMKDTHFYLPDEKTARLATLYTEDSTKHIIKDGETYELNGTIYVNYPDMEGTYYSGGGGLSSTAYDYSIFMQMLLNGGEYNGKRILSRSSIRMMTSNQIGDIDFGDDKFGLGFGIVTEKGAAKTSVSPGTFSWGRMFSSSYWIDPKEKIIAQFFLQQFPNSHGDIHDKFKALVYQAINN